MKNLKIFHKYFVQKFSLQLLSHLSKKMKVFQKINRSLNQLVLLSPLSLRLAFRIIFMIFSLFFNQYLNVAGEIYQSNINFFKFFYCFSIRKIFSSSVTAEHFCKFLLIFSNWQHLSNPHALHNLGEKILLEIAEIISNKSTNERIIKLICNFSLLQVILFRLFGFP